MPTIAERFPCPEYPQPVEGFEIRPATAEDAEVLARHRCAMFREMGVLAEAAYPELMAASIEYFRRALLEGRYIAWVVVEGDEIAAGGGMQLNSIPPRPGKDGRVMRPGPQGLIINVFVEEGRRRQGMAEGLLREIIGFAQSNGIPSLNLHSSKAGRRLYERLGFVGTNEMRLEL